MSETVTEGWHTHTVIERDELMEYLFSTSEDSDGRLAVKNYCIAIGGDTIDTDGLIEFASSKLPFFVFPEDEIEDREPVAYRDALRRIGYRDDYERDGLYGELLLFLLVDGILEMPMISHKIAGKQNPKDEVKGSDGVFYGEYEGEESLGIGEAKFFTDKKGGIRDSLESTSRFHGLKGGRKRRSELEIASRNLSDNLSEEKIEHLAETLTDDSKAYRLVHPIFVGYEWEQLHEAQSTAMDGDELEEKVLEFVDDDEDILPYIKEKLVEYEELQRHWLVFILLPVEDTEAFKRKLKESIYPWSED